MIDYFVRRELPRIVGPILRVYQFFNVSPNLVTILGLTTAFIAAFFLVFGLLKVSLVFWWVSRIFDGTDGVWARKRQSETPFGAYLDIVCDMAAYSMMIVGFFVFEPSLVLNWLLILFLYTLCVSSALSLGSLEERFGANKGKNNRGLRLGAGLAEAGETSIFYTLFLLMPYYLKILSFIWIFVLMLTVFARSVLAYKILTQKII